VEYSFKAFHQQHCCENCQWQFKRDLDAANLRPVVGHGCGKQIQHFVATKRIAIQ